jgi:hypothetical protein
MFASVALVIFMVIALPWQRRVWDRSQPPPDMLDGPAGESMVSDRASDEAAPEPGSVHDDDLPERVSDVAGPDRGTGPITPQR